MRFSAPLRLNGRTATGIPVPSEVLVAMGGGPWVEAARKPETRSRCVETVVPLLTAARAQR